METKIWPAEQKIQHATMMLYHNIKNSDDNRKVRQFLTFQNTFYQKMQKVAKDLQIHISDVTSASKSKSDYKCVTQNATTKEMNQIQNVPFPKQGKTPQST